MIESFWIVREGIPLFIFGKTGKEKHDSELKTGFFSALYSFAKSVENQEVMAIILTESKYVYHSAEQLLYIAGIDLYDNEYLTKTVLADIADKFHMQFKNVLPENSSETMIVEKNMFKSFEVPLQKHMKVNLIQVCANCKSFILAKYIEHKDDSGVISRFCSHDCETDFIDHIHQHSSAIPAK